ncbi:YybH family protein [Alteromonas genovensis]|uniref:YybH family protein n=1 Tax=Alteromonas genovensis TaxID=471225 RepID=UPI002FE2B8EF
MSKTIFLFSVVISLFFSSVNAESKKSQIEKEILASFESLVQACRKLDSELYFQHFAADKFVGLNSDGTNWNSINDLAPLITNGFEAVEEITFLKFTNVKVSVIDNFTAVLVNEYVQSMELKSGDIIKAAGGGTQVWSKRSGHWKIVSVSASNKSNVSAP